MRQILIVGELKKGYSMREQDITLNDLLKSGVHFGHRTSKWHPKMQPYIFGSRGGVHILHLEKTKEHLRAVCEQVKTMTKEGKVILFVGTKRQAKTIVKKYAEEAGAPYITERWIGGLFTNFTVVVRLMRKLKSLKAKQASGDLKKYTKKEQADFAKEINKLEKFVGGIANMEKIPDAIFVVGVREEKTAMREAGKKKIPIIAVADSNTNPDEMTWFIPANDDATKSIDLIVSAVAEAVKEGKALQPKTQETSPEKTKALKTKKVS